MKRVIFFVLALFLFGQSFSQNSRTLTSNETHFLGSLYNSQLNTAIFKGGTQLTGNDYWIEGIIANNTFFSLSPIGNPWGIWAKANTKIYFDFSTHLIESCVLLKDVSLNTIGGYQMNFKAGTEISFNFFYYSTSDPNCLDHHASENAMVKSGTIANDVSVNVYSDNGTSQLFLPHGTKVDFAYDSPARVILYYTFPNGKQEAVYVCTSCHYGCY